MSGPPVRMHGHHVGDASGHCTGVSLTDGLVLTQRFSVCSDRMLRDSTSGAVLLCP